MTVSDSIRLPAAPLAAGEETSESIGTHVTVRRRNGEEVDGVLTSLTNGFLTLAGGEAGEEVRFPYQDVRYLVFAPRPRQDEEARRLHQRLAAGDEDASVPTTFEIVYRDGAKLSGRTFGAVVDQLGLHVFQPSGDAVRRTFIPLPVIENYRVGGRLGDSLVESGIAQREHVEAAARRQGELRTRRLGDYLKDVTLIDSEALRRAIGEKSRFPGQRIGELLLSQGLINEQQLQEGLARQKNDRSRRIGDILIDMGAVDRDTLQAALAGNLGIPYVKLQRFDFDPEALAMVTAELARKHDLVPLLLQDGRLIVALSDPTDIEALTLLRFTTGRPVEPVSAPEKDIKWAISKFYGLEHSGDALDEILVEESQPAADRRSTEDFERLGKQRPVVKLVNGVILDAIKRQASDIHIRPLEDNVNVLLRLDGALERITILNKKLLPAIVARIKIMGRMDVSERRLPQDGRTRITQDGGVVDLRISVVPTVHGESVVIRILDTRAGLKDLNEIGFEGSDRAALQDMLERTRGLMLVTGPTGSGKSTTLYAALAEIRKRSVNIITVENPVEYHMDGIDQIQIDTAPGYTFATALRHVLRHDPDVIMIGEIRDHDTAQIAIESALTGHLVLSTLHTNSAAGAVTRLTQMGIEPYLVGATLQGVLAQRLVRRNCPYCMAEEPVEKAARETLRVDEDEVFYRGAGCDHCNGTGYRGRLAVYELLRVTEPLRRLIEAGASEDAIRAQALADGMVPLTEQALRLARRRITTLEETYRIRLD